MYRRTVNHTLIYVLRFEPQPTIWGRIPLYPLGQAQETKKLKLAFVSRSEEIEIQLSVQTAPLENYIYV